MAKIRFHPARLRHFGSGADCTFCLITTAELAPLFEIEADGYAATEVLTCEDGQGFLDLLGDSVPERAHLLVITPNHYFRSPSPEQLGPRRKLSVMACKSTPTSIEAIQHFLEMGERTDPEEQERIARRFFEIGEKAERLTFTDPTYGTEAVFQHLDDDYEWHEQVGLLDWGGQQLFPSGEISVLPVQLYDSGMNQTLRVDGRITLHGYPVVHSGTPSFLPADQQRIFDRLLHLNEHAVLADVENGVITRLEAADDRAAPAVDMLEALFCIDSRYRILLEIGFSINSKLALFGGNSAMNEVYGSKNGAVHWGLGIIPSTQFHIDILSPGTIVADQDGERLIGGVSRGMRRIKSAMCPCMTPSYENTSAEVRS